MKKRWIAPDSSLSSWSGASPRPRGADEPRCAGVSHRAATRPRATSSGKPGGGTAGTAMLHEGRTSHVTSRTGLGAPQSPRARIRLRTLADAAEQVVARPELHGEPSWPSIRPSVPYRPLGADTRCEASGDGVTHRPGVLQGDAEIGPDQAAPAHVTRPSASMCEQRRRRDTYSR